MHQESASDLTGSWQALSAESANIIERAGSSVVAVHARRRIPASGVQWRRGIVVTTSHSTERDEEIAITLPGGRTVPATVAGRDASTDLAVLKIAETDTAALPVPEIADSSALKAGHWIWLAGRTAEGGARAGMSLVSVTGPAWRTYRGGQVDAAIRLDRTLHPNFSGGPAVNDRGKVLGIVTSGLSRFAAVVIPAATVERVTSELEKRGRMGHGYLGVSMQTVRLPRSLRDALKLPNETGIMIVGIEPEGPAEKAGILLGDVLVGLDAKPVTDISDVQVHLAGEHIGKGKQATIVRGGTLIETTIAIGERPVRR